MEDSSPDLSLKLGRGSSGSRDSFYMDFAQGIDSDIEEITVVAPPKPPDVTNEVAESAPNVVVYSDPNISPLEQQVDLAQNFTRLDL